MDLDDFLEQRATIKARAEELPEVLRAPILDLLEEGATAKKQLASREAIESLLRDVVSAAEHLIAASKASQAEAQQLAELRPILARLSEHLDGIADDRRVRAAEEGERSSKWAEVAKEVAGKTTAWHLALVIVLLAGLAYGLLGLPMPAVSIPGFGSHDRDRPVAGGRLAQRPTWRLPVARASIPPDDDDDDSDDDDSGDDDTEDGGE